MSYAIQERAIELDNVRIQFGRRTLLEDLTLEIRRGEFIVVLGPNGAGKSTLFKLLLGLVRPTAGSVHVLGHTPRRGNRAIGYAPQHRQLENTLALRARDVVGFGLDGNRWGIGLPSRRRRLLIDQALDEVHALAFADAAVSELSGGEQQRLLIAQALLTNPRLLLLDEPLSNLDITRGQEIVTLISQVARARDITVLLISHDINPLLPVADRVLYLANGRSAIGLPEEVITSATLSELYNSSVEVVHALGRLFVVGAET